MVRHARVLFHFGNATGIKCYRFLRLYDLRQHLDMHYARIARYEIQLLEPEEVDFMERSWPDMEWIELFE